MLLVPAQHPVLARPYMRSSIANFNVIDLIEEMLIFKKSTLQNVKKKTNINKVIKRIDNEFMMKSVVSDEQREEEQMPKMPKKMISKLELTLIRCCSSNEDVDVGR